MSAIRLSTRYAKSIIVLSKEMGNLERIYEDMKLLGKSIEDNRELELAFKSPIIKPDKKQNIFNAIYAGKLDKLTNTFVEILIRKGREPYILDIVKAFTAQYNALNKITPVKIKSAIELSADVEKALINKLKEIADLENTTVEKEIDPELIGGFILKYEDKLLDASISNKLRALGLELDNKEFIKNL